MLDHERASTGRAFSNWALIVLAVLGCAGFAAWLLFPSSDRPYWGTFNLFTDLHVYRWGGAYVFNGLQLYPMRIHALEASEAFRDPMTFTYTPFAAVAFVPLAIIGIRAMEYFWMTASLAALALSIWWTLRWLGYDANRRLFLGTLALVGCLLFIEPVRTTLWYGQINLILLALLTYDAAAPRARLTRGIGTGIAAGIKLTPAFLWSYYLVTKKWRTLIVSVATFLVTIIIGAIVIGRDSLYYWTGGLLESSRVGLADLSANQSLNGLLAYWVFHTPDSPRWAWIAAATPAALIGLAAVWLLHRAGHEQLAFVVAGMTGAVVSPFSWGHHWVWFVPLFVVLVDAAFRARSIARCAGMWLAAGALYFLIGAWVQILPNPDQPDGVWVAVGWFMNTRAFDDSLLMPLFREPYLVVWAVCIIAAPMVARWLPRQPQPA